MNISFIKVTSIYVAYMFIVVAGYIVLSDVFNQTIGSFEGVSDNMSTDFPALDHQMDVVSPIVRSVFDLCFAILGIVPSIWFAVYIMKREPHWGYQ